MPPPKEQPPTETLAALPEGEGPAAVSSSFDSASAFESASSGFESAPPFEAAGFGEGQVVAGKYRIDRRIAEGGSGVVVAATHIALQQPVAIKYLKPGPRASRVVVERFEREGRLAAQLTSEHVVRVHDVGELEDGSPYMVMELLKGHNLAEVLEESGRLPIARAVDYVLQACDALAQAHALKIVHRDIKPENLILAERPSNTPVVKIIDFGISKAAPSADGQGKWARRTSQNDKFGTPAYMSPEQMHSSTDVDARTDIWSVGVLLHELLTNTMPFEGEDLPRLCTSILHGAPAKLTAVRPGAPAELEAIILKCLEKKPAHRFRNIAELAQELAPFGPPRAQERSERIRETIQSSGGSVRPPVQRTGAFEAVAIGDFTPPPVDTNTVPGSAPLRRRAAVVAVAALALGALAALVVFVRTGVPARAGSPGAVRASAIATEQAPAQPSASAIAAIPAPAVPAAPQPIASAAATADRPAVTAKPPVVTGGPVVRSKAPAPKASSPAARSDPRALFGERK